MPRLAANLSMMFNEVPFLERFTAARKAGFEGVEFLFPYDSGRRLAQPHGRRGTDPGAVQHAAGRLGQWRAGHRVTARPAVGVPGGRETRAGLRRDPGLPAGIAWPVSCRPAFPWSPPPPSTPPTSPGPRRGASGRGEADDRADQPSRHAWLFPESQAQGAAIVEAIGKDWFGLQFDVYHVQITEGTSPSAWSSSCR